MVSARSAAALSIALVGLALSRVAPAEASPPASRVTASVRAAGPAVSGGSSAFTLKVARTGQAKVSSWTVDFGDHGARARGTGKVSPRVQHRYARAGVYTVTLTVKAKHARTVTSRARLLVTSPVAAPAPAGPLPDAQTAVVDPRTSTVTTVSPTSGPVGKTVTITGTGFTSPATVTFGGVSSPATVASATSITTTVPVGAGTGSLVVTSNGSTVNAGTFTVSLGLLLSPTSGNPGQAVTIYGSGFGANEAVDLYAGTAAQAVAYSSSAGAITATGFVIPTNAPPGAFQVGAVGRTSGRGVAATFTVTTDFPTTGFTPNGGGYNPFESTLTPTTVAGLGEAWSTGGHSWDSQVVIGGGLAFWTDTSGVVHATNATTGASVWTYASGDTNIASPTYAAGVVYVGTTTALRALSATTGALKWKATVAHPLYYGSPAVSAGLVYDQSVTDGVLYAFNAASGVPVWTYTAPSPPGGYNTVTEGPVVGNGRVFISNGTSVIGVDAATGALRWSVTVGANSYSSPTVVNNTVYVSADKLYAFDAVTGAGLWTYTWSGGTVVGPPTVAGASVYVNTSDGQLLSVDAGRGYLQWSAVQPASSFVQPVVAGGLVWTADYKGEVSAWDLRYGQLLWTGGPGGDFFLRIAVVNGVLYTSTQIDGIDAWTLAAGRPPTS